MASDGSRIYFVSLGCPKNQVDTELMLGHLRTHGWERTAAPEGADLILLNTCAIREHAEARVLGRLAELARHKRRPGIRLGVTGCMAQHLRERLREDAPHVDLLIGPDGYRHLPDLLRADVAEPVRPGRVCTVGVAAIAVQERLMAQVRRRFQRMRAVEQLRVAHRHDFHAEQPVRMGFRTFFAGEDNVDVGRAVILVRGFAAFGRLLPGRFRRPPIRGQTHVDAGMGA